MCVLGGCVCFGRVCVFWRFCVFRDVLCVVMRTRITTNDAFCV